MVARANHPLAGRAAKLDVPVVNVWPSSPARPLLPGVFPDSTEAGRLAAEHLPFGVIARDVGFGTIQRLYEVFNREVGVAPRRVS